MDISLPMVRATACLSALGVSKNLEFISSRDRFMGMLFDVRDVFSPSDSRLFHIRLGWIVGLSDDVHVVVSRYGEAVSHDCEGDYIIWTERKVHCLRCPFSRIFINNLCEFVNNLHSFTFQNI